MNIQLTSKAVGDININDSHCKNTFFIEIVT
jgi:hypothetical protein